MSSIWIFVLISVIDPQEVISIRMGQYESMDKCFTAREEFLKDEPRPLKNLQGLCIRYEE